MFVDIFLVPLKKSENGGYYLSRKVLLFWRDTAKFYTENDEMVLVNKGPFGSKHTTGKIKDATLSIYREHMSRTGLGVMSEYVAILTLNDQSFCIAKQPLLEHIEEYVEKLNERLGTEIRTVKIV